MPPVDSDIQSILCLTHIPGLGPVRISRLINSLGSADAVLGASEASLRHVRGIGPAAARSIGAQRSTAQKEADDEIALASDLGVHLMAISDPRYPPLLASISNPPPILYIRGDLDPELDRYPVAIVGSRASTAYGVEQTERFAGLLASAGLTVVSGGARGVDTAAHRAALRNTGRTIAVLGCGLAQCYPPENNELFDEIAAGAGAIISELPLKTIPAPENFPMRNRIISGLSLGVLVTEAALGSGALITAKLAVEDHGREVMAIPGRIDSPASKGANMLLKVGGAALVTSAADVIDQLESAARHLYNGAHALRYADPSKTPDLFDPPRADEANSHAAQTKPKTNAIATGNLNPTQKTIVEALADPQSLDELVRTTGLDAALVRTEITVLEVRKIIERAGATLRTRPSRS